MENKPSAIESVRKIFIRPTMRETIAAFLTLAFLLFQIYRTFIHPLPPLLLRPVHVASVCLLCILFKPVDTSKFSIFRKIWTQLLEIIVYVTAACSILYHLTNYQRLIRRINYVDSVETYEKVLCVLLVVTILTAIWRSVGKALPIFISIFLIYGFAAPYLPGFLFYPGLNLHKLTSLSFLGTRASTARP